jgi:hypothetical protein
MKVVCLSFHYLRGSGPCANRTKGTEPEYVSRVTSVRIPNMRDNRLSDI